MMTAIGIYLAIGAAIAALLTLFSPHENKLREFLKMTLSWPITLIFLVLLLIDGPDPYYD